MNEINETSIVLFNVSPAVYSYSDKKHILRRVEISKCEYLSIFKLHHTFFMRSYLLCPWSIQYSSRNLFVSDLTLFEDEWRE